LNGGNFTVQNHDDGWVTLTEQHSTAIMVLNGKISSVQLEQIIMAVEAIKMIENFLATMLSVGRHIAIQAVWHKIIHK
jgi:hypothetical protein